MNAKQPYFSPYFSVNEHLESLIPEDIRSEMSQKGALIGKVGVCLPIDFKVNVPATGTMQERDLSTEEMLSLFDRKESLTLAYVPHFITQCIIYYLDLMLEYAQTNRLSEYKKSNRLLKSLREEYFMALRHEMPAHIYSKFLNQRNEFLNLCGANLQLMYFTFGNELSKKYGRIEHDSILCYANIIASFIEYVEDFDYRVNKQIEQKIGMPCRNHGDARLSAIKTICKNIIGKYVAPQNHITETCVKVMANKAKEMILNMI